MSSERRTIRPYRGVDRVQAALEQVSLRLGDRALVDGSRASVPTTAYLADRLELVFAGDDDEFALWRKEVVEAVEATGLAVEDAALVLVTSSSRLKLAEVAWRKSVKDLATGQRYETIATANARPESLCAPFGGCLAELFVVLDRELTPQPLRPHRRGTWLARTSYKIVTDLGEIGFTPLPLTAEERERLELGEDTLRFVEVESAINPERADDALSVYVDEDVLAELAVHVTTPGAKSFQMQLFLDAMFVVVFTASAELKENPGVSFAQAEDSLLGRLVSKMSERNGEVDRDLAERYWRETKDHPARVSAHVEAWVPDFRKKLSAALGEGSS